MKNPIRNEASLVLVVAVIFSSVAIPVLSGFLEPSQPPAVAAVEIGDPTADDASAPQGNGDTPTRDTADQASSGPRERPTQPAEPAPAAPADDDDDGD